MNVYKVSAKEVYGSWHDFSFVTASSQKDAIIGAIREMNLPQNNDRITITCFKESPFNKKKK